jgi:uncharacterized protein (TIGR02646 family)
MILLTRIRNAKAVPAEFYGQKRIDLNLDLLKKKLAGAFDGKSPTASIWKSTVWDKAKDQMLRESSGKCAYCESPTSVVAYGDVEHFRPKSKYWWLAYCYENFLPACVICNQRFKRDEFAMGRKGKAWTGPAVTKDMKPAALKALAKTMTVDALNDADGMPLQLFTKTTDSERALLLHPYFQNPAEFLAYKPILETKEVLVVPLKSSAKAHVSACEKYFGINRQELKDERYRHYSLYMTFRQTLATPGIPDKLKKSIRQRIAEMCSGSLRYTGMIRYFETKKLEDLPWDFDV